MTPATRSRSRRAVDDAARFVRLFYLGATLLYLLLGAATAARPITPGGLVRAVLVGVLFHAYAYISNDVLDLPIDRTDPRRQPDPVVRGTIPPERALLVAVATLPALFASLWPGTGERAVTSMAVAVVLLGAYDIGGKLVAVPFVADVVQGVGWAFLVIAGAEMAGGATPSTLVAAGAVAVYITMVNGVHGALRDLQNDRSSGARTTALLLGARILEGRQIVVPRGLVLSGLTLQALIGGLLVALLAGRTSTHPDVTWVTAAVAIALYVASAVLLALGYRRRHLLRRAMAAGTWHLLLIPASLLAAVAGRVPWWAGIIIAGCFVAPPLLFGWAVRGTEFGLPSTTLEEPVVAPRGMRTRVAAVGEMTRIGTAVAAAALVAAGAFIGGGVAVSVLLPAITATAFAVAAANVYNDRCDVTADRLNRPDRPLPSGRATVGDCDRFVVAATLVVVAATAVIGLPAIIAGVVYVVVALSYSLLLRRVVLLGQVAVAVLFAVPLLFGGWATAEGSSVEHWIGAALITVFVFARETLKGIPDVAGDLRAGYHTIATRFGRSVALRVFRVSAVVVCTGSLAATAVVQSAAYFIAALMCGVLPTVHTLRLVHGSPSTEAVNRAVAFSGVVFAAGIIPVLLMG